MGGQKIEIMMFSSNLLFSSTTCTVQVSVTPPAVALTVALPLALAVILPLASTDATDALSDFQVTAGLLSKPENCMESCALSPTTSSRACLFKAIF